MVIDATTPEGRERQRINGIASALKRVDGLDGPNDPVDICEAHNLYERRGAREAYHKELLQRLAALIADPKTNAVILSIVLESGKT